MLMGRDEEDAMMSLSRGRACVAYRLQRNGVIIPYFACVQFLVILVGPLFRN